MATSSGREPENFEQAAAESTIHWRALAWICAAAVLVISLLPVPDLPVEPPQDTDKLVHFGLYCGLAWLFSRAYPRCSFIMLGGILTGYGALIEFLQTATTARYGSFADGLANALGVLIMLLLIASIRRRRARRPAR
ncbi:MAG: VanZ family protein [Gammaproteobacteria bacterium]